MVEGRLARRALAVAVTAMGLVATTLSLAPEAQALAAPSSVSPAGAVSSNTPVLSWPRVTGAARYDVQVDNDAGFASPEFTSTTTNNRAVPTKVLASGTQYVRVRAATAANAYSSWRTGEFEVGSSAPPTPISPVDGAALAQPADPPLLTWDGTKGATSYTVEVDTEDDFVGARSYTTKTTSLVVPDPLAAATYWWRVTATKATGVVTKPSSAVSFSVGGLKEPARTGPADDPDTQVEDVVLDWAPVNGAQYYQLQVALDQDFNTIIDNQVKVYGTRYSPLTTYDNNQYYWRVRAVDLAGNPTAWSQTQYNFDRVWPDRPQAVHPAGEGTPTVGADMYFQWTPVKHATDYQLDVGTDANFSSGTYESCRVAGTTFTPYAGEVNPDFGNVAQQIDEDCNPTPGALMYWRVRPLDRPLTKSGPLYPGVQGLYSATQPFIYDPSFFAAGVTPADGATVSVPTFSWQPVLRAEKYNLVIRNNTGSTVKTATTSSTSYTPVGVRALDPAKSPYTWTLQAVDALGQTSKIYSRTFTIAGSVPTSDDAALTPHSGRTGDPATSAAPSLTWEPYPGADHYRLFAGPHGTGTLFTAVPADALDKDLPYPAVTDTGTWFLKPGQYDWHVKAYNASGQVLATGPTATFTISALPAVTGQRIALDGTSLDAGQACAARLQDGGAKCDGVPATPVLDWDPVPGASGYMVYLSEDGSFTNLVEPHNAIPYTTNTRWSPTASAEREALPDSQAGASYFWFIRPCKSPSSCGPDPEGSTGMATNAFRKVSPAAVPEAPADGATLDSAEVTFDWQDYFTTNQAATWAATGEHSPQAAMQYRIQVSASPTFSGTLVDDQKVDQSTYTAFGKLYPEGTLYWRVQGIDAEGNALAWSDVRSFQKQTAPPTLQAPVGGAKVAGTSPFRWAPQPFAASYRIEVYRNDDATFSSANRLFYKDVKTVAYAWDQPIPVSGDAYVWRVRRNDASGNPGQWSATGRFVSSGATPSLLAPAAGSYQAPNGPLFTWADVPGAASYALSVRQAGAAYNWASVTTAATAWAADRTLGNGSWEWSVTAKDAGGNVLGSSAARGFTVDTTRPTVVGRSPTTTAYRTTSFKAKFSERVTGVSSTTMRISLKGRTTALRAKVTLSSDGRTATLDPASSLTVGKYYTVRLSTGIKDRAGNSLVATSWTVRAK